MNKQSNKTISIKQFNIASYRKFENVQRLTSLIDQIHHKKQENCQNQHKTQVSQKVLNLIKNRIKNSCDSLYQSYDTNKQQILKQIHQVQKNNDTQFVMNKKANQIIKDKNQYDKLKLQVQKNQKQLRNLNDLKQKLKLAGTQNSQLVDIIKDRNKLLNMFQNFKINLEYQAAVLDNMKNDRRLTKIQLKQKYQATIKENNSKNQKIKKLKDGNHNKKLILKRIQDQLKKQLQFQIPLPLAQQLQKKLSQFQGKHNYANLVEHQMQLQKIRQQQQIQMIQNQKNKVKKLKQQKQLQQKRQYQKIEICCQIKRSEQQRIKKLCNIQDIKQIALDPLKYDFQNLQNIKRQTQKEINKLKQQKESQQKEIQMYLSFQKQNQINQQNKQNLLQVQKQLQNEQTQLRRLNIYYNKKKQLLEKWTATSQYIAGNNISLHNMIHSLYTIIPILQNLIMKQKVAQKGSNIKKNYKTKQNDNKNYKNQNFDSKQKYKTQSLNQL